MQNETAHKTRKRTDEELRSLRNRLNRIEGQVRGIKKMLDDDAYCIDVLTQVSAVMSAMSAFSEKILESHIKGCVVSDIKNGRYESVDELMTVLDRMLKIK